MDTTGSIRELKSKKEMELQIKKNSYWLQILLTPDALGSCIHCSEMTSGSSRFRSVVEPVLSYNIDFLLTSTCFLPCKQRHGGKTTVVKRTWKKNFLVTADEFLRAERGSETQQAVVNMVFKEADVTAWSCCLPSPLPARSLQGQAQGLCSAFCTCEHLVFVALNKTFNRRLRVSNGTFWGDLNSWMAS